MAEELRQGRNEYLIDSKNMIRGPMLIMMQ